MSNTIIKIQQAYQILNESMLSETQLQEIGMGQSDGPVYKNLADIAKTLQGKHIADLEDVRIASRDDITLYMLDCEVNIKEIKPSPATGEFTLKISVNTGEEKFNDEMKYKVNLDSTPEEFYSALKENLAKLVENFAKKFDQSIPKKSLEKIAEQLKSFKIYEASEGQMQEESFEDFSKELARDLKKAKWKVMTENSLFRYDITDLVGFILNIVKVEGAHSFIKISLTEINPIDASKAPLYKSEDVTLSLADFSLKTKKETMTRIEKNFRQMTKVYQGVLEGRLKGIEKTLKEVKKI